MISPAPENPDLVTVYVSIGNSDDKLSQMEWMGLQCDVDLAIQRAAAHVHGVWYAHPTSGWQNMCVGFEVGRARSRALRDELTVIRMRYRQDSVAWVEAASTEFV